MKQIRIVTKDRPGILAEITDAMATAGVNIEDLTAESTGSHAVVEMTVDRYDEALQALRHAEALDADVADEEPFRGLREEPHEPRHHLAVGRVAVEVLEGVEGDAPADLGPQVVGRHRRDENLVGEGPGRDEDPVVANLFELSRDACDHGPSDPAAILTAENAESAEKKSNQNTRRVNSPAKRAAVRRVLRDPSTALRAGLCVSTPCS